MSGVTFAALGPLTALRDTARAALMDRATSRDAGIRDRTAAVVERVRRDGDVALREMAREFDGVTLTSLEVPRTLWRAALDGLDPDVRRVLERAAANIRTVHEAFRPVSSEVTTVDGVRIGRRPDPLGRVGVYAPGGRATYPSSLLMGAVPARVAGVGEVIVCSPPDASGLPSAVLMAAAAIAGVDRMFAIGGAGAVAAMAYGTETVPAVDRIVGPGNAYVAEAKLQVAGAVAIDAPAGPSELLVIADAFADPVVVATEMIAQAEHDPLASVVLVTWAPELATRVVLALERLVPLTPRADIVRASFAAKGGVVTVATRAEAIAFGSAYAAEHALIATRDASSEDVLRNLAMAHFPLAQKALPAAPMAAASMSCPAPSSCIRAARWMSYAEILNCEHQHRSPLVLQCIDDYLRGKRAPLSLLFTHPSAL